MVIVDASAANTATGANHITAPVTFSITCARSSITPVRRLPDSPSADSAVPKKIENTTICRISLFAIASAIDFGTRWTTKSFSVKAPVFRPRDASDAGSGRLRWLPGCRIVAVSRPSSNDVNDAMKNQPNALTPTRPTALPSPI